MMVLSLDLKLVPILEGSPAIGKTKIVSALKFLTNE
jgi:hypothetical protein